MLRSASRFYVSLRHCAKNAYDVEKLIKKDRIVVFMKGTPADPSCGFSSAVVQILKLCNVKYDYVNVLEDEKVRQDIKTFSNWPTIPQVYIDGKFIGGCDILLEMHNNGELMETLRNANLVPEHKNVETNTDSKDNAQKNKK